MSRNSASSFADSLPRGPDALSRKRKQPAEEDEEASGDAQTAQSRSHSPSKRRRPEAHATEKVDGATTTSTSRNLETRLSSYQDNGSSKGEHGDLLNGVGSASSLASTVSSVFSHSGQPGMAPHSGVLAQNHTLTPLTTSDSSPPGKTLSPRAAKVPADHMSSKSVDGSAAADQPSNNASATITPVHTPPESRPQPRPGPGEEKGAKLVWDPELDEKLPGKDKKRFKPKYKVFGVEVSLHLSKARRSRILIC